MVSFIKVESFCTHLKLVCAQPLAMSIQKKVKKKNLVVTLIPSNQLSQLEANNYDIINHFLFEMCKRLEMSLFEVGKVKSS